MEFDDLGHAGDGGAYDRSNGRRPSPREDRRTVENLDTEALEHWLQANPGLWELGLQLAIQARQYRRTYRKLPFNQIGWYCPN